MVWWAVTWRAGFLFGVRENAGLLVGGREGNGWLTSTFSIDGAGCEVEWEMAAVLDGALVILVSFGADGSVISSMRSLTSGLDCMMGSAFANTFNKYASRFERSLSVAGEKKKTTLSSLA